MWVCRYHITILLEDKQKYAKSLEIKENRDLITLFTTLLSASDTDALYLFKESGTNDINFTFKKRIQIFDFTWTFKLHKVNFNPVDMVCREMINPLSSVIEGQNRRMMVLGQQFKHIEKEYLKKMTEMERYYYKSPFDA
jgi:hypothetical protein